MTGELPIDQAHIEAERAAGKAIGNILVLNSDATELAVNINGIREAAEGTGSSDPLAQAWFEGMIDVIKERFPERFHQANEKGQN